MTSPLSVAELIAYIGAIFEQDEFLADVWVIGEMSNVKHHHGSGHLYYTLKDDESAISAVMWRSSVQKLSNIPSNGEVVLAHGRIGVYEKNGQMQLYTARLQPLGDGLLYARVEALRLMLEAEGLFDASRKRPLPPLPRRIGIATAATGAALQDMLTVLRRRFPLAEVLLAPCTVQGEQAPPSICAALEQLYTAGVDVIILARGGGSGEDLAAFNDEQLARTLFRSPVPTITGVGHETDTTIVDYVADMRAPTPSAAAELVAPDIRTLAEAVAMQRATLRNLIHAELDDYAAMLAQLDLRMHRQHPQIEIASARQQVDDLWQRARRQLDMRYSQAQLRLESLSTRLHALSPQATLQRGYALLHHTSNYRLISSATAVQPADTVTITMHDGSLTARITATRLPEGEEQHL